jgi:chloramphenicol-sensitive protein RarD
MTEARPAQRGFAAAIAAFVIWGLVPLYLHPLRDVPAVEVLAHRITWSCVLLLAWLRLRGELGGLAAALGNPRVLVPLAVTALLICVNWLVYVWSVTHGHIVEASLGYYINPLVNVLLGVLVLRERLNGVQWLCIALAAVAVAYLTVLAGHPPWIAATLALSFSTYGLVRKVISVEALPGLTVETLLLAPLAAGYLVWRQWSGGAAFGGGGALVAALLVGSGVITAIPLFMFAYGARVLRYATLGVLQYIAPSLQLLCGVVVLNEPFGAARGAGFVLLWLALLIYAADSLWRTRRTLRVLRA